VIGAGDILIRERIIGLPTGGRGQNFVEMIRFAAANRLLVEIDYRDKQGNRSTRAIEAYSLRRSQAGDVLLMAVRADNGQSRSYLIDSILGVRTTQTPFSPRYRRLALRAFRRRRSRVQEGVSACAIRQLSGVRPPAGLRAVQVSLAPAVQPTSSSALSAERPSTRRATTPR
jgi:predicted DNA-binding transcriptional regulator YafY